MQSITETHCEGRGNLALRSLGFQAEMKDSLAVACGTWLQQVPRSFVAAAIGAMIGSQRQSAAVAFPNNFSACCTEHRQQRTQICTARCQQGSRLGRAPPPPPLPPRPAPARPSGGGGGRHASCFKKHHSWGGCCKALTCTTQLAAEYVADPSNADSGMALSKGTPSCGKPSATASTVPWAASRKRSLSLMGPNATLAACRYPDFPQIPVNLAAFSNNCVDAV